jgi:hypothetical protein
VNDRESAIVNGFVWASQALTVQGQGALAYLVATNAIMAFGPEERPKRIKQFVSQLEELVAKATLAEAEPEGSA